jgi:Antitoxin MazE-like
MPRTSTQKMRDYRGRLRAKGLRPLQLWVPDMRDPKVRARIRREFRYLARQPADPEVDALLDANLAEIEGWTA